MRAAAPTGMAYPPGAGQGPLTRRLLGLSRREAQLISMLSAGQALGRVGSRSFVVAHHRSRIEARLTNTDTGMSATLSGGRRG